jgi:hypothetical protein
LTRNPCIVRETPRGKVACGQAASRGKAVVAMRRLNLR